MNWMQGPYVPLTLLVTGCVGGLPSVMTAVPLCCLAVWPVALSRRIWRAALPVVAGGSGVRTVAASIRRLR
ncbi:MAG: hypothetical protein ACOY3Y_06215 [Acidobacteriota bacterium]